MTKSSLNKYRSVLEAKQTELVQLVRNRDGIAIEKSADALDEVQYATGRELAIRSLDGDSNLLRNVQARPARRGYLRRLSALRGGHQPETAGSSALDGVLYLVPGTRRPRPARWR